MSLASGATWNIPDNATVQSVVDDLSHAGQIHFTSTRTGKSVPATLKVKKPERTEWHHQPACTPGYGTEQC